MRTLRNETGGYVRRLGPGFAVLLGCAVAAATGCVSGAHGGAAQGTGTATPVVSPSGTTPAATSTPTATPSPTPSGTDVYSLCFSDIEDPVSPSPHPNYDQFNPIIGSHCQGTNHQAIAGIQKVVFLGDSITKGTPPTPDAENYRNRLTAMLQAKFGPLEVKECSDWGARTDDLLDGSKHQIARCFPGTAPEPKTTLIVMTMGGNDLAALAKDAPANGMTIDQILANVDTAAQKLRNGVNWFRDPARFPNGVFVVFSNVYEFTDGTGDPTLCPAASLSGFHAPWPDGRAAYIEMEEQMMSVAVDTKSDLLFSLEQFCGHGYDNNNPNNECYRGPNTERWFDISCIHPTPNGHAKLADMFMAEVNE
jgi:lysophospholipase L1-like esterase